MPIPAEETLDETWPFAPLFCDRAGFPMHYVDVGSGDPIVLLHGEPTWGYLWRDLIVPLSRFGRVVVPDHMGFGKSATPPERSYRWIDHVDNLEALLVAELGLTYITLVVHDWGGPIGAGFASRHPDRIARIAVINSPFTLGLEHEAGHLEANARDSAWFRWAREAHAAGQLEAIFGQARHSVTGLMVEFQCLGSSTVLDPAWARAYGLPFEGRGESRGAVDFPRQVVAPEEFDWSDVRVPDRATTERLRSLPASMIYGLRDRALLAEHLIPLFETTFPGATVTRLPEAGHFSPQDEPAEISRLLEEFITSGSATAS